MKDVISFGASKEAALYFERVLPEDYLAVVPLNVKQPTSYSRSISLMFPFHRAGAANEDFYPLWKSLVPNVPHVEKELLNLSYCHAGMVEYFLIQALDGERRQEFLDDFNNTLKALKAPDEFVGGDISLAIEYIQSVRGAIRRKLGFADAPNWIDDGLFEAEDTKETDSVPQTVVALRNLSLVDAASLSWEQICEFRNDKDSMNQLRKLRAFLARNFEGKSVSFIEDQLGDALHEHDLARKRWAFDTASQSLTVAFSNESALAGIGTAIAALSGGLSLGAAAAASAVIPLGRSAIEVSTGYVKTRRELNASPLKYLSRVRSLNQRM